MTWLRHLQRASLRVPNWSDGGFVLAALALVGALRQAGRAAALDVPLLIFLPAACLIALVFAWRWGAAFVLACVALGALTGASPGDLSLFAGAALLNAAVVHALRASLRMSAAQRTELADLVRQRGELAAQRALERRETQHRVANTLQYVSNMLQLSRMEIDRGGDVHDVLDKAMARLTAMSQLHRQLTGAANTREVVEQVLRAILAEVLDLARIDIRLRIETVSLTAEQMTALVLFVTEAATNADKDVFRHGEGSRFEVTLERHGTDMVRLSVRDDGPVQAEPVGEAAGAELPPRGLGVRIMQGLARQLGGTLETGGGCDGTMSVEFRAG